jgi:hypothetical protein
MVLPEVSGQVPDHNTPKLASQAEELICDKTEEHVINHLINEFDSGGLDDSKVVSFFVSHDLAALDNKQNYRRRFYQRSLIKFQIIIPRP